MIRTLCAALVLAGCVHPPAKPRVIVKTVQVPMQPCPAPHKPDLAGAPDLATRIDRLAAYSHALETAIGACKR